MQLGSKDRYFQGEVTETDKLVPEGIEGRVPYKGRAGDVIYQMIGGLRLGHGDCGAPPSPTSTRGRDVRVTAAGMRESHPHDVHITKEVPNYGKDVGVAVPARVFMKSVSDRRPVPRRMGP